MNGKELSAKGHEIMAAGGWMRLWNANSYRALPKTLKNLSDNGYIRHGVFLFIEDKGDGDEMSEGQLWFQDMIAEHAPRNVYYLIAESVEDYEKFVNYRSRFEKC